MKFKARDPNVERGDGYKKQEDVILDEVILTSLDEKHASYFAKHNEEMRREYGDFFNVHLNTRRVVETYFRGLALTPEMLQDKTALYLGSANSMFDEYCERKYGTSFISIDIEADNLGKDHPQGVLADARRLPLKSDAVDLVISLAAMPYTLISHPDDGGKLVEIEGQVKEKVLHDVMSVFREAYRVLKPGGQIRMNAPTIKEEWEQIGNRVHNNSKPFIIESSYQKIKRVNLLKDALDIFEEESGARCVFKTNEKGGLIIITKPRI